eukprot:1742995-Pleurochrysis_carterae.AAC.3
MQGISRVVPMVVLNREIRAFSALLLQYGDYGSLYCQPSGRQPNVGSRFAKTVWQLTEGGST